MKGVIWRCAVTGGRWENGEREKFDKSFDFQLWRRRVGAPVALLNFPANGSGWRDEHRREKEEEFVPGQGVVLYPQIGDKLDIVCPRVDGGGSDGVEYYKVYMVPREQLESCTITKADTPLLNCVKPDQDVKFTLKFQEFSPNLWGLEFFRGTDYYIICKYLDLPGGIIN
ncbi:hypothetical protein FQN60_001632 [Etheostoma spectabile]|uniref:Ephrin RBD domain-containing protein n=1 Tax=Etheostoma spectabile TaxID=54343 RepID=A0A5J5D120_9PERO|nr:hypothetical protein FQN60_001632 [Etheostoma spectabile]